MVAGEDGFGGEDGVAERCDGPAFAGVDVGPLAGLVQRWGDEADEGGDLEFGESVADDVEGGGGVVGDPVAADCDEDGGRDTVEGGRGDGGELAGGVGVDVEAQGIADFVLPVAGVQEQHDDARFGVKRRIAGMAARMSALSSMLRWNMVFSVSDKG